MKNHVVKKHILFNYIGTIVSIVTPLLALPWYLNLLGAEKFGLISLASIFQTILSLIDSGISQSLVRDFAVRYSSDNEGKKSCARLLSGFERLYLIIAFIFGLILIILTLPIANYFSYEKSIQLDLLLIALYGSACIFIVQFPGSIYRSLFTGTQHHAIFNQILVTFVLTRHIGSVLILSFWPCLFLFFLWHFLIAFLETYFRFRAAWKILSPEKFYNQTGLFFELKDSKKTITYLSISIFLGALTLQIDKLILSFMIPIKEFGYYIIAATIATGLLQLIYPLTQTILPIVTILQNQNEKIQKVYKQSFLTITIISLVVGLIFIFFGENFLFLWLKSEESSKYIYQILEVLLVGTMVNALYNIGYIHWLSNKRIYCILKINIIGLIITICITPFLISIYGSQGAAFGWILSSFIGLVMSLEWIKGTKK